MTVALVFGARLPVAFAAAPEAPAEGGLELSWHAPRGCADATALRRDVEGVVGTNGKDRRRNVQVYGEVKRSSEGWTATLVLVTEGGRSTRTLTAPSCHVLTRAAAVVIAFAVTEQPAIDPSVSNANEAVTDGTTDKVQAPAPIVTLVTPAPSPKREAPYAPAPAPALAPAPARPWLRQLGPTIGAFVRADAGTLPDVALGPGVLLGWDVHPIRLEATVGWLLAQTVEIVPPLHRQATLSRAELAAFFARTAICPATRNTSLAWGRVRAFACAGFGAIETRVSGRRIDGTRSVQGDGWSGSAFVGPRLRFASGAFAMSLSSDVAVPFRRQDFVLLDRSGGAVSVHRSSPVLFGISLGVEFTFFQ